MTGRLIGVVGPSGVGKDSVIAGLLAAEPRLQRVRRTVTRRPGDGGEPCDIASPTEFAARDRQGDFALTWQAHELCYGIPKAGLRPLADGQDLLVNLSRGALKDAKGVVSRFEVLWVRASPEVLAQRLAARGREDTAQIAGRLARAAPNPPMGLHVTFIDNDGAIEDSVAAARAALYPDAQHR